MRLYNNQRLIRLFQAKVTSLGDEPEDCALWMGALHPSGHGRLTDRNRDYYSHRLGFELFHEGDFDGQVIEVTCGDRACVKHVQPSGETFTPVDRGDKCFYGHSLWNAYIAGDRGAKLCRVCTTSQILAQYEVKDGEVLVRWLSDGLIEVIDYADEVPAGEFEVLDSYPVTEFKHEVIVTYLEGFDENGRLEGVTDEMVDATWVARGLLSSSVDDKERRRLA
jgi:hypothetical protein